MFRGYFMFNRLTGSVFIVHGKPQIAQKVPDLMLLPPSARKDDEDEEMPSLELVTPSAMAESPEATCGLLEGETDLPPISIGASSSAHTFNEVGSLYGRSLFRPLYQLDQFDTMPDVVIIRLPNRNG
jgi:hypothetical protein